MLNQNARVGSSGSGSPVAFFVSGSVGICEQDKLILTICNIEISLLLTEGGQKEEIKLRCKGLLTVKGPLLSHNDVEA